jgi:hypothetical protein
MWANSNCQVEQRAAYIKSVLRAWIVFFPIHQFEQGRSCLIYSEVNWFPVMSDEGWFLQCLIFTKMANIFIVRSEIFDGIKIRVKFGYSGIKIRYISKSQTRILKCCAQQKQLIFLSKITALNSKDFILLTAKQLHEYYHPAIGLLFRFHHLYCIL